MKVAHRIKKFFFDEKGNVAGVLMKIKDFEKLIDKLEDLYDIQLACERSPKTHKTIHIKKKQKYPRVLAHFHNNEKGQPIEVYLDRTSYRSLIDQITDLTDDINRYKKKKHKDL